MIFWSLPKLQEYTGGLLVFDMRPMGYSFTEAVQLLTRLNVEGIEFYKNVQLRFDIFYPLSFILTYSLGCLWVFKKINRLHFIGKIGAASSIFAGISDYIENLYIYKMLSVSSSLSEDIVSIANTATVAKSVSTTISMTIFLLSLLSLTIVK